MTYGTQILPHNKFDAIIVGAGIHGSATAYYASKYPNKRILVLEQFSRGHTLGSSNDESRLHRELYDKQSDAFVLAAQESGRGWEALAQESGQFLINRNGCLTVVAPEQEAYLMNLQRVYHEFKMPIPTIYENGKMIRQAVPALRNVPDDYKAIRDPMAGYLLFNKAMFAFADCAVRQPTTHVQFNYNERVEDFHDNGDGVRVKTSRGEYYADKISLSTGPWFKELVPEYASEMWLVKVATSWFRPADENRRLYHPDNMPVIVMLDNSGRDVGFIVPMLPGGIDGFKIGQHMHNYERIEDLAHFDRTPTPEDEATPRYWLHNFADAAAECTLTKSCIYTMRKKDLFKIRPHEEYKNIIVVYPCSGHGGKMGPWVGRITADYLLGGGPGRPEDKAILRIHNFGNLIV